MKNILKIRADVSFLLILFAILFTVSCSTAVKKNMSLEMDDLTVRYKKGEFSLLATSYINFTEIAGNSGRWEDIKKYQYTWEDGQAGFIRISGMKYPQLVMITLENNFMTSRGIKKGSAVSELLRAYPEEFLTERGGNGLWYEYRGVIKNMPGFKKGTAFKLSFFTENGLVDSVMLRIKSKEADEIPVG